MEEKKNTRLVILLIVFVVLTVVLGGYLVYDKVVNKDSESTSNKSDNNNQNSSVNNNSKDGSSSDISSITAEIQSVYGDAYKVIAEGYGLHSADTVDIKVGEEGTVGGVIDVEAYKFDFTKIEPYFTDRAINFIKFYFTDTPYGHKDGNYYLFSDENKYSYEKKDFINSIFGQTDQGERTLKVKFYSDDMVVAISEKTSFINLDEYIVFKKVNSSWKIDMFEEF